MSGRIRSIKPEVLDDEFAAQLSDAAWRLWVSMWVLADDHGNVRAGEKYLAANVWQDTSRDAAPPLQELIDKGFVSPYAARGQRYVHINGWEKHQRVDNAGKPRVPRPTDDDGTWNQHLGGTSAYSRASGGETRMSAEARTEARESGELPPFVGDSPPRAHARARNPAAGPPTPISTTDPERDRARAGGSDNGTVTSLPADFELTTERKAYAETIGLQDVAIVFRTFQNVCAERAKTSADWDATWRKFCDRELAIQKRDRLRGPPGGPPDGPSKSPTHRRLDV